MMRRALGEKNQEVSHSEKPEVRPHKKNASAPPVEMLPPSLDGDRDFAFIARKEAPVAGKNGGCWRVSAEVKVRRKVIFKHRFSIVYNLNDEAEDRDAESYDQLRASLLEFFHRATAAPKSSVLLPSNGDFVGARSVKLIGKKCKKKKGIWHFTCRAEAFCDYGSYARNTHYTLHSEHDAARTSAAALLAELRNTWTHATRSKDNDNSLLLCFQSTSENESPTMNRGVGARTLNYIRDVYGASSNVDDILRRGQTANF